MYYVTHLKMALRSPRAIMFLLSDYLDLTNKSILIVVVLV